MHLNQMIVSLHTPELRKRPAFAYSLPPCIGARRKTRPSPCRSAANYRPNPRRGTTTTAPAQPWQRFPPRRKQTNVCHYTRKTPVDPSRRACRYLSVPTQSNAPGRSRRPKGRFPPAQPTQAHAACTNPTPLTQAHATHRAKCRHLRSRSLQLACRCAPLP